MLFSVIFFETALDLIGGFFLIGADQPSEFSWRAPLRGTNGHFCLLILLAVAGAGHGRGQTEESRAAAH